MVAALLLVGLAVQLAALAYLLLSFLGVVRFLLVFLFVLLLQILLAVLLYVRLVLQLVSLAVLAVQVQQASQLDPAVQVVHFLVVVLQLESFLAAVQVQLVSLVLGFALVVQVQQAFLAVVAQVQLVSLVVLGFVAVVRAQRAFLVVLVVASSSKLA